MDLVVDYGAIEAMGSVSRSVGDEVGTVGHRMTRVVNSVESRVGHATLAAEIGALRSAIDVTNVHVVAALRDFGDELHQAAADYRAADQALAGSIEGSA